MDNMTFGKYIPGNSIIHRLDPRLKICAVFIFLISVFSDAGFIGYGILAIYVLLCSLVSKIKLSHILKAIKPMVFMMLFLMIFNIFLMKTGDVIIKIGSISIYSGALLQTAYIFIWLVLIITLTTLMTSTTKPLELTLAIESLLNPLKRFHFPVHELSMMMTIALRFIPTLIEETDKIMSAQKARGADLESGGIMQRARALVPILIPLFVSAFRRAEELALAMECRCYHGGEGRTALRVLRYKAADYAVLAGFVVLTAGIIVLKKFRF